MNRTVYLLVIVVFLIGNSVVNASWVQNPGAPREIVVTIGEIEQQVSVLGGMNCWTTRKAGNIGKLYGRFVVRFNNSQVVKMRYVQCEGVTEIISQTRAKWVENFYRFKYEIREVSSSNFAITKPTSVPYDPENCVGSWCNGYTEYEFERNSHFEGGANVFVEKNIVCVANDSNLSDSEVTVTPSITRTRSITPTRTQTFTPTATLTGTLEPTPTPECLSGYSDCRTATATETRTSLRRTPTVSVEIVPNIPNIGDITGNVVAKFTSNAWIKLNGVICYRLYNPNGGTANLGLEDSTIWLSKYYISEKAVHIGRGGKVVTTTPSRTPTRTPTLGPLVKTNSGVTIFHKGQIGDICWGDKVGQYRNTIVEFTTNVNYTIAIENGGCMKHGHYTSWQVLQHLKRQGVNYRMFDVPLIPTITRTPTVTIVRKLVPDWSSGKAARIMPPQGMICWGDEVAGRKLHIVEFTKDLSLTGESVVIRNGFCAHNSRYSRDDIFYHLVRNGKRVDGVSTYP